MDASGSSSKRTRVEDGSRSRRHAVEMQEQKERFEGIISLIKHNMKETEEAHALDLTLREENAKLDLLRKMMSLKDGFNVEQEFQIVKEQARKAYEEKVAFNVTGINWDKLGFKPTELSGSESD